MPEQALQGDEGFTHIPDARASPAKGVEAITHWVTLPNFTDLRPIPTVWIYLDTRNDGL